jgi:hypothetical protein
MTGLRVVGEQGQCCAVVAITSAAEAEAVLRAAPGGGCVLLSPEGAAGWLGWPLFAAWIARAVAAVPQARPPRALLDAGDAPGFALAALAAGAREVALAPDAPGFAQVAAAAESCGAVLWAGRPAAEQAATWLRRRRA